MGAHADADGGEFGDAGFGFDFGVGGECGEDGFEGGLGFSEIAGVHGERVACEAIVGDVGDDHVEVDFGIAEGTEDFAGHAGFVGDVGDGDAGLRSLDRDAADDDVFHGWMFF